MRDGLRIRFAWQESYACFHGGLRGVELTIPIMVWGVPGPLTPILMIAYLLIMWIIAAYVEFSRHTFFRESRFGSADVVSGVLLLGVIPVFVLIIQPFPPSAGWANGAYWMVWGVCAFIWQIPATIDRIKGRL